MEIADRSLSVEMESIVDRRDIPLDDIRPNPLNPRRYFNEAALDILRTSISEVGILVPISVYPSPDEPGKFVLLDGERRWRSAKDIALRAIPAHVIEVPTAADNVLRMFNIHAVREDWPLVSIALSLRTLIDEIKESGEKRLSELTGLTRATIRRAKRLLSLPELELDLIAREAALDRKDQVHREDLYLEIEAAESVLSRAFPELLEEFGRSKIIRQMARKREEGPLESVTDFRRVGRIVKESQVVPEQREAARDLLRRLIEDPNLTPSMALAEITGTSGEQATLSSRATSLFTLIQDLDDLDDVSEVVRDRLEEVYYKLHQLLGDS